MGGIVVFNLHDGGLFRFIVHPCRHKHDITRVYPFVIGQVGIGPVIFPESDSAEDELPDSPAVFGAEGLVEKAFVQERGCHFPDGIDEPRPIDGQAVLVIDAYVCPVALAVRADRQFKGGMLHLGFIRILWNGREVGERMDRRPIQERNDLPWQEKGVGRLHPVAESLNDLERFGAAVEDDALPDPVVFLTFARCLGARPRVGGCNHVDPFVRTVENPEPGLAQ